MAVQSRFAAASLAVILLWSIIGTAPAQAAGEMVEFEGSGWGHGVGLSQYGAYGMATEGASYGQILSHYYQGTSLGNISADTKIWVNLERDFSSLTLKVLNVGSSAGAPVSITSSAGNLTAKSGGTIAIAASGSTGCSVQVSNIGESPASVTSPDCMVDMSWYDWATPGQNPTTKLEIVGCTQTDWNATPATSRPCQYARGMLHLRSGNGGLDLSVELLMEDYVSGISEVPHHWHAEALKAQAVAARSYAESKRIQRGAPSTNSCDGWCHVKDSTSDQRYVGWGHSNTAPWTAATQATANQVVTHPDSSIGVVTTYYSSSSGGATEYGHEKGFASAPVQWLTSVDDSHAVDGTVWNPNASWVRAISPADVASKLGFDNLTSVRVTKRRTGSGSAAEVEYGGLKNGSSVTVTKTGGWTRTTLGLKSEYFDVDFRLLDGDEMFFYRDDGLFEYRDIDAAGVLGGVIASGTGYTSGWDSITSVDLDGDGQDEIFFYREDGLFRYYDINPDGSIGSPILAGEGYTTGWSSITAIDLDGDGQDEMFFYREDGLFRYYHIKPDGSLPSPTFAGDAYTTGWDSITAVDLEGDGQDEMFFYREDGLFRYYQIKPDGSLPSPTLAGSGYTKDWSAITAVDLGGDGADEMFFYRDDGLFRYYDVNTDGTLPSPVNSGSNYALNWSQITAIDLDGS